MSLLEKDKRKFSVIIGSKKCGACSGASPSGAARKVKGKSGAFYLKETTKGSKKKLYGPYSSKKKVVQRGGKGNEEICKNVLKILKGCDNIHKFDAEIYRINTQYHILEETYKRLGIKDRMDKCDVLKYIINLRDIYTIINNGKKKEFPLCHCLCNLEIEDNNLVEFGFINSYFDLIISKIRSLTKHNKDDFYEKKWLIFIQFLRNIILQIEVDKLEKDKLEKNNEELRKLKEEVERAKAHFHEAARMGESNFEGQAEEYETFKDKPLPPYLLSSINKENSGPANRPPPSMLNPVRRKGRNFNPNQQPHNSQNPQSSSRNNLLARLAALKND
jgi:hypothetical protein